MYVRDQLQMMFAQFPHPNACGVAILPCQDPQLVVIRGLLLDWQQRMQTGGAASVLSTRIARASYGVIVREVYTPAKHFNEDVVHDNFDRRQRWATNQIEWLIKKGDVITPGAPLIKDMQIRLAAHDTTRAWTSQFIVSHNEPGFLPHSMKHGEFNLLASFLKTSHVYRGRKSPGMTNIANMINLITSRCNQTL